MKRRDTLRALAALGAFPALARAQGGRPKHRIAFLGDATAELHKSLLATFKATLAELGHAEGRDFVLDGRYSEGKPERFEMLAQELLATKPSVIVASGSAAVVTLQKATRSIPIVFVVAGAPVEQGLVKSLARPGGNITGASLRGIVGKTLELVREFLPDARRVAILVHEADPAARRMADEHVRSAVASGHEISIVWVKDAAGFEQAFADVVARRAEALILPQLSLSISHAETLAGLARKARIPTFAPTPRALAAGALASYTADLPENYRRAARLVDKILRGANPGDLPVEQPDRFVLRINLGTAKAFGIKIPQSVLIRANEVIE